MPQKTRTPKANKVRLGSFLRQYSADGITAVAKNIREILRKIDV